MPDNPYTPPKSDVRDVAPERLLAERPRQVIYATLLLWISVVLAVPLVYWEYQRSPEDSAPAFGIFIVLISALAVVVNICIWRGRNWARIVFLVLALFSVATFFGTLTEILQYSLIEIVLNFVTLAMDGIVAYFLFTRPGSSWFHPAR